MGGVSNEILSATEGVVMHRCSATAFGVAPKYRIDEIIDGALAIEDQQWLPGNVIDDHVYLELGGETE